MRRIAIVGRVKPGHEVELREVLDRDMPRDILEEAAVRSVTAFEGQGIFVLLLEHDAEDFQQLFGRWRDDPRVQQFQAKILEHAEGIPRPGEQKGSGEWPLVAQVFSWEATS
jgi:hypothetical protein